MKSVKCKKERDQAAVSGRAGSAIVGWNRQLFISDSVHLPIL